jgi:Zn-dependent protease
MNEIIETLRNLTTAIIPILIAITFHEVAHGYAAYKLGDPTAKDLGRLTLNPVPHIDLFNTVFMPIAMFLVSNGSFIFGAAKPVPVNFNNLRNPKRDIALVAAAGPLSNIIIAFISILLLKMLPNSIEISGIYAKILIPISKMLMYSIYFNIFLAAFNLLPIPPLDGGRIVTTLLPYKHAYQFAKLEPYGFIIMLGLWGVGLMTYIILPIQYLIKVIITIFLIPFGGM